MIRSTSSRRPNGVNRAVIFVTRASSRFADCYTHESNRQALNHVKCQQRPKEGHLGRDETGKRKRKWHGSFATKREAERVQAKLVHDLDQGMYSEPSRLTVAEYMRDWLEAKPNLAQTTREGYQRELKRVTKRLGGRKL